MIEYCAEEDSIHVYWLDNTDIHCIVDMRTQYICQMFLHYFQSTHTYNSYIYRKLWFWIGMVGYWRGSPQRQSNEMQWWSSHFVINARSTQQIWKCCKSCSVCASFLVLHYCFLQLWLSIPFLIWKVLFNNSFDRTREDREGRLCTH